MKYTVSYYFINCSTLCSIIIRYFSTFISDSKIKLKNFLWNIDTYFFPSELSNCIYLNIRLNWTCFINDRTIYCGRFSSNAIADE